MSLRDAYQSVGSGRLPGENYNDASYEVLLKELTHWGGSKHLDILRKYLSEDKICFFFDKVKSENLRKGSWWIEYAIEKNIFFGEKEQISICLDTEASAKNLQSLNFSESLICLFDIFQRLEMINVKYKEEVLNIVVDYININKGFKPVDIYSKDERSYEEIQKEYKPFEIRQLILSMTKGEVQLPKWVKTYLKQNIYFLVLNKLEPKDMILLDNIGYVEELYNPPMSSTRQQNQDLFFIALEIGEKDLAEKIKENFR